MQYPARQDAVDRALRHDAVRVGGGPAVDRLIELPVMVDETGDRSFAGEALARVQPVPRVIVRMDERCRRVLWYSARQSRVLDRAARRLDGGRPGPIAVALASTHRDGHVRERAVGRMVERPEPVWMPLLVLRTADWASRCGIVRAPGWRCCSPTSRRPCSRPRWVWR